MTITSFLMFVGKAEEAMNFYISLFPDSRVVSAERYGAGEPGKEGTIKRALFELNGTRVMCIDSPIEHAFTFTPATSFFVECDSESQIDQLVERMSEGGSALMPLGSYGFSQKFAWVQDRFGVSWQLNLA